VTALNYNLLTSEQRANAHRELKAYLKGLPTYKARVTTKNEEGELVTKTVIRTVKTTE
jgi:hypothetical protein